MKNGETVRAKFRCDKIIDNGSNEEVKMGAVYSDKGENKDFTEATPFGDFSIGIDEDATAYGKFNVGEHYYLDISKAPAQ